MKGGYNRHRGSNIPKTNNILQMGEEKKYTFLDGLEKKMRGEGFTLREIKEVKKKVRFRQKVNDISHRVLGTKKKPLHNIEATAFRQVKKSRKARKRKKKKEKNNTKAKKKEESPAAISNNSTRRTSLFNRVRTSIKPILDIVNVEAPKPRPTPKPTS
jgi:hypothetical protein